MPIYVYQSLSNGQRFEFSQGINEPALRRHPKTGEPLKRVIQAPAIRIQGLRRSTVVDRLSPAATACGCASNAALAKKMYAAGNNTPIYGGIESRKTVTGGVSKAGSANHAGSHRHSAGCGHKHR